MSKSAFRPQFAFRKACALALSAWIAGTGAALPLGSALPASADPLPVGQTVPGPVPGIAPGALFPANPALNAPGENPSGTAPLGATGAGGAAAAPPPNPLVLPSPLTGNGNPVVFYGQDGRQRPDRSTDDEADYTRTATNKRDLRPLALYGYDFFQSARRVIEARRVFLQREYGLTLPSGAMGTGQGGERPQEPRSYDTLPDMAPAHPGQSGPFQDGNDESRKELQNRAQELTPAANATQQQRASEQQQLLRQRGYSPYGSYGYGPSGAGQVGSGLYGSGPYAYGPGLYAPGAQGGNNGGVTPSPYPSDMGPSGINAGGFGAMDQSPNGRFNDNEGGGTLYNNDQTGLGGASSSTEGPEAALPLWETNGGEHSSNYGDPQTTPGQPEGQENGAAYGNGEEGYGIGGGYSAGPGYPLSGGYGDGADGYVGDGYGAASPNGQGGYGPENPDQAYEYGQAGLSGADGAAVYAPGDGLGGAYPDPYAASPNISYPTAQGTLNGYPAYSGEYPNAAGAAGASSGLSGSGILGAGLATGAYSGTPYGQNSPYPSSAPGYPQTWGANGAAPYGRADYGRNGPAPGLLGSPYGAGGTPNGYGMTPPMGGASENQEPLNAYHDIADPLSELYRNVTASVPANYELSTGDVLTVRYSSPTMYPRDYNVTVDSSGAVTVPGAGRFVVLGLTAAQAEHLLSARLRGLYNNADVSVTLKELRSISVTVTGPAFAPGTYEVPSVATAFNVLYAAGGPTTSGSLRDIEVRRQGRLVGTLDVYQLLLGNGHFHDIHLQSGDLVAVMPVVSRVTVRGEVRQPAVYELTDHETLSDALHFARGVKPTGVSQDVEIDTLHPGAARVLKDVNLTDRAQMTTTPLYDGDIVDVFSIQSLITNRVTIAGAVNDPGDYALQKGMRVSDLLTRARGALPDAYTTRADLYRWNPNNTTTLIPIDMTRALAHDPDADVPLTRWDRLQIYTLRQVAWTGERQVTVRGAVQRPGVYTRSSGMHARDLLLQAGGPTPEGDMNSVVVLHQHPDGTFKYETVDLSTDSTADPMLQDNDVLAVYTTQQAQFNANHIVTILGEVVTPGPYPRGTGMRLSDLLKLAGGFRPDAATHVSIAHAYKALDDPAARPVAIQATFNADGSAAPGDDVLLQDGDVVTVQGTGGYQDHVSVVLVKGAVNRPGPVILTDKMRLSDAIREAGGLRDVAYAPGAGFDRLSEYLSNGEQRSLAQIISRLNDMLNASDYKRELAKSDVERIQAVQSATQNNTSFLPIGSTSNSAAPNPAAASLSQQLSQHDLVTPARTLTDGDLVPSGDLAVNLVSALRRPGGPDDIPLKDGDVITIPERPTTVQVIGAVFNARGVMYKPSEGINYYINQCGGFAPDAASDRIEVIHAGGGLTLASKTHGLQPGDLILVPTKVLAEKIARSGNGFTDFLSGLFGTAILVKVLSGL